MKTPLHWQVIKYISLDRICQNVALKATVINVLRNSKFYGHHSITEMCAASFNIWGYSNRAPI